MRNERRGDCSLRDFTFCLLGFTIVIGFFLVEWLILTGRIEVGNQTNVTTILNNTNSLVMFVAGAFFGKAVSDEIAKRADSGGPTTNVTGDNPKVVANNTATTDPAPPPEPKAS